MLALFRTNQATANLLLFFYALLLQLPAWFAELTAAPESIEQGVLAHWTLGAVGPDSWLALALPVLLVTGQAIGVNVLVMRHRMSRQVTQFPGLFVVLCWALVPDFRTLHAVQFAGLFVVLALLALGGVYKKPEPAVRLFNVGFWLGLATLFCPPTLLLLPVFVIGLGALARVTSRGLLQVLTGLTVTVFLTFTWAYYTGRFTTALLWQTGSFGWLGLPTVDPVSYVGLVAIAVASVFALASFNGVTQLLNIEGKKNTGILAWLLFFGLLSVTLSGVNGLAYLQLLTLPIGGLLGLRFITLPAGRAEFLHLVLFVLAVVPLGYLAFG